MKNHLKHLLWHPFLIGFFPILFLYAHNIFYAELKTAWPPLLLVTIATTLLVVIQKALLRNVYKAGVWVSVFWLCFFFYSAVFDVTAGTILQRHSFLLLFYAVLLLLLFFYLYRSSSTFATLTKVLNVFSILLLLFPLWNIISYTVSERWILADQKSSDKINWPTSGAPANYPDIVYLILDGYGRHDVLQQLYGLNNQPFLDSLEQEGFTVMRQSTSNYMRTAVSVASSLNLDYLQSLPAFQLTQSYKALKELTENARLLRWLQQHQYQLYTFDSGFSNTTFSQRTIPLGRRNHLPELYRLLLKQTPFLLLEENAYLYRQYNKALVALGYASFTENFREYHRERTLFTLGAMHQYIGQRQPSFVFADVFVGHPPFIFDEAGQYLPPHSRLPAQDGSEFLPNNPRRKELYREGLKGQTLFLNQKILETVRLLKKNSTRPTVIVLQGDHGPGLHYDQSDVKKTNLKERFSILQAIYFSDQKPEQLPQDLTPVNTFRVVLNHYFHTNLPLLPNRNYFSPLWEPNKFIEVTQQVQQ